MGLHSHIKPNTWLFIRAPSVSLKCIEIKPNTIIDVGKLGCFPSNLLLGRPYHYTYEILEKREGEAYSRLRIVPPSELNAEIVAEEAATPSESRGEPATPSTSSNGAPPETYDMLLAEDKTNRLTVDNAARQALTQQDIEELKRSAAGKDIIAKILAGHTGLDEKTVFSKAKYMLRKRSKYLKRFEVLPMEVGGLIDYLFEKEPARILEMREETLGLVGAWSHAHVTPGEEEGGDAEEGGGDGKRVGSGRWLVVDETGGLVVAALAERMNLLHKPEQSADEDGAVQEQPQQADGDVSLPHDDHVDGAVPIPAPALAQTNGHAQPPDSSKEASKATTNHADFPLPASTNTITLLHPAVQPNIALLKYFGYDANLPDPSHPLHTHLKSLSWLQLLHPSQDPTYREPAVVSEHELAKMKSGKRGTYFKKRRRWERCAAIIDEARGGGFDGLVVSSSMDPASTLPHAVPLIRGGGHVVVYSPTIEPLVNVMDLYSKDRRAAYTQLVIKGEEPSSDPDDFPVDPRLLLAPTLQTSRVREWQVLPGRTHPLMMGRGGSEGYVFTARKVIPIEGGVEARGNYGGKRRKVGNSGGDDAAGAGGDGARPAATAVQT
ncbi:hypothetical protein LTR36_005914 [Oleoguttula mirabilis]|uniref:tRNA (adenine(58)-N(1))-methyltransferase non-catalytic subunit TRM6 n=1 Tax=Oleoguttula mirabilis TaxID=1507867 RepID=A0AAV9JE39_9PEZI|nr:hypothetical protein LTR36_005914 [Oleoguttula mirabilis]